MVIFCTDTRQLNFTFLRENNTDVLPQGGAIVTETDLRQTFLLVPPVCAMGLQNKRGQYIPWPSSLDIGLHFWQKLPSSSLQSWLQILRWTKWSRIMSVYFIHAWQLGSCVYHALIQTGPVNMHWMVTEKCSPYHLPAALCWTCKTPLRNVPHKYLQQIGSLL